MQKRLLANNQCKGEGGVNIYMMQMSLNKQWKRGGGVNHLAEIDIREGKGKIGLDLEKQIFESKIC